MYTIRWKGPRCGGGCTPEGLIDPNPQEACLVPPSQDKNAGLTIDHCRPVAWAIVAGVAFLSLVIKPATGRGR